MAEFAPSHFGDRRASLLSGRADAFSWPSLVRIGAEAVRLSQRPSAVPGETGLHGLMRGLGETAPYAGVWRFSRAEEASTEPGAMVSGSILAHLTEDGSVLRGGTDDSSALRPHFSPSAMVSMFITESLLHAIVQAGDPQALSATGNIRHIARLLVSCPLAATAQERELLLSRAKDAVDLIWQALGWGDEELSPSRPSVGLSIDGSAASQVTYLHDEIEGCYAGSVRSFVQLMADRPANGDERDGISIAALDLAAQTSSLTVIEYGAGGERGLHPNLAFADRSNVSGDGLVDAVMKEHILPAIAAALDRAGHPDGKDLLVRLGDPSRNPSVHVDTHFAARFLRRVLLPAARGLIELHRLRPAHDFSAGVIRTRLGALVEHAGGRIKPLDRELENKTAAECSPSFRLTEVDINVRRSALSRTIGGHYELLIERASEVVRASQADLLLLTGRFANLGEIRSLLHAELPIAPHRIISSQQHWGDLDAQRSQAGLADAEPRYHAVVGAALATSNAGACGHVGAMADELLIASLSHRSYGLAGVGGGSQRELKAFPAWTGETAHRAIAHETSPGQARTGPARSNPAMGKFLRADRPGSTPQEPAAQEPAAKVALTITEVVSTIGSHGGTSTESGGDAS